MTDDIVDAEIVARRLAPPPERRWPRALADARRRLPELAQHPAVVASASAVATLGAGLAARLVRDALAPARRGAVVVSGQVVVHHVVHHVVHLDRPALPGPR